MFNPFKVFCYADDVITNKLTTFTWFIEMKFDKDNVWLSKKSFTSIFVVAFIFRVINDIRADEGFIYCLELSFFFMVLVWAIEKLWVLFSIKIPFFIFLLANARASPNKNRGDTNILLLKLGLVISLIVIPPIFKESFLYYTVSYVALITSLFFLCTERMSKGERVKRETERSINKMKLISIQSK